MKALLLPMGLTAMLTAAAPSTSRHEAKVAGATQATLAGRALFGPVVGAGACVGSSCSASFSLDLGAYSDNGAVVFSRVSSERPKVGTCRVVAFVPGAETGGEFHALVSLGPVGAPVGVFRAVSGSVTIVQSSEERIVGRYEVKAIGFLAADPDNENREITVRGGFVAEPAERPSMFEASTYGAISTAPRGSAEFGTAGIGAETMFALSLGAYSEQGAIVLTRRGAGRPAVGVYPVSESWESATDFHGLVITGSPSHPSGVFHAERGAVTITASSVDRITGTFELHGVGFLADAPADEQRELVVSGLFSATLGGKSVTLTVR